MPLARASALLVLLLTSRAASSQHIFPGYVVTAGQDSLRGAIALHDDATQQRQVDFITAQGNQRQLLDARALRAYGYTTTRDTVRYVAVSMNLGRSGAQPEALFLRQLVAGPAELYQYRYVREYYTRPARLAAAPTTTYAPTAVNVSHPPVASSHYTPYPPNAPGFPPLNATDARSGTGVALLLRRRGQTGFVIATQWSFPRDAAAYFADCPALAPDLQARRYRARNLPQLVQRYNSCLAAPTR